MELELSDWASPKLVAARTRPIAIGTLGVIEGAWLRLRPLPQEVAQCSCDVVGPEKGVELGIAISRRYTTRSAMLLSPDIVRQLSMQADEEVSSWRLLVEFAGDEAATRRSA